MFFKNKNKAKAFPKSLFYDSDIGINKADWFEVFSACLGKAKANQNACADLVVKGRNWNVDFSRKIISFGNDDFPVQFIGSESSSSNTWLWGWENINGFADDILEVAHSAKAKGLEWKLEPLTMSEFDITDIFNGHTLSIVATSIYDDNICYYRGPHGGGAILVAVYDLPQEVFAPVDSPTFMRITMESIQQYKVNQEIFVRSFLYQNHTPYDFKDGMIVAHFEQEQDMEIHFEDVNGVKRISNMRALIAPPTE